MAADAVFPSMQTVQVDGLVQYTARAYFFEPGTTTPKPTYTTSALSTAHPHPLPVNGVGRFPPVWLGVGNYRVQIKTDAGTLLEDYDNLPGGPVDVVIPDPVDPGTVIPTGFEMDSETNSLPVDGWVRANGRTIGPAGSAATELASDTTEALYFQRWNQVPQPAVSGGPGVNAAADWAAGKPIALPSARGRVAVGRDAMGSSAAGVLTTYTTLNPDQAGYSFGEQAVSLLAANNAPHTHTATTASAGGHQHAGSTSDVQGNHTHGYDYATYAAEFATSGSGPGRQSLTQVADVTDGAGEHGHNLNIISDGAHTHPVTVGSQGSGLAHNNMQPSRLVTRYIKL